MSEISLRAGNLLYILLFLYALMTIAFFFVSFYARHTSNE